MPYGDWSFHLVWLTSVADCIKWPVASKFSEYLDATAKKSLQVLISADFIYIDTDYMWCYMYVKKPHPKILSTGSQFIP